jgi:putative DNA primase/helicase
MGAITARQSDKKQHGASRVVFPRELRRLKQWVVYRLEENRDNPSKLAKVPYCSRTQHASHANAATWLTYRDAKALATRDGFAGLGFVFSESDPYVGIDLDGCRNPKTGDVAEWAQEIVTDLRSYTELSQSGAGFHVIVRGKLPDGIRHKYDKVAGIAGGKKAAIEVYDRLRFFVMTGRVHLGHKRIVARPIAMKRLIERYMRRSVPGTSTDLPVRNPQLLDEEVIDRAARANPIEFHRLFDAGETRPGKSASESDYQLACMFARVVGGDAERIERLMRRSELARDKWDEHPTYLVQRTIARAINDVAPELQQDAEELDRRFFPSLRAILTDAALMHKPQPLIRAVAWPGRVTLFAGSEKRAGKSTFLAAAVSRITRAKPFLDNPTCDAPGKVLWVSADEEHTADVASRLRMFGTHPGRVAVLYPHGTLADRLAEVEEHVASYAPKLVVIDTLSNFARVKDPFASTEWPEVILRLKRAARERNVAVILVHHTPKNAPEQYRDSSSIGATVDQIVTLAHLEGAPSTQRRLKTMGRLSGADEFHVVWRDRAFEVAENAAATAADKIRAILANSTRARSQRDIENTVGGDRNRVRRTLQQLVGRGELTWVRGPRGAHLYSLSQEGA